VLVVFLRRLMLLHLFLILLLLDLVFALVVVVLRRDFAIRLGDLIIQVCGLRLLRRRGMIRRHAVGVDMIALRHCGRGHEESGKGQAADGQVIGGFHNAAPWKLTREKRPPCSGVPLASGSSGFRPILRPWRRCNRGANWPRSAFPRSGSSPHRRSRSARTTPYRHPAPAHGGNGRGSSSPSALPPCRLRGRWRRFWSCRSRRSC